MKIFLTILITALVVGGGIFTWQKMNPPEYKCVSPEEMAAEQERLNNASESTNNTGGLLDVIE
ncbi:MAG: hypothetical protein AAB373_06365 [Patescibacteria group bacterium]